MNSADALTTEVLARVAAAPDSRVRAISEALVRHLHAFVREIEPTIAEWEAGIAFLTETGRMCVGGRQEFVLLSDTLGVSMLVDAINHQRSPAATESTVLGPFFVEDAPEAANGADIASGAKGEPMQVAGRVIKPGGAPVVGALVETWQCDADGFYDVQRGEGPALRARLRTDADGRFAFRTVRPVSYPIPHDGPVGRMLEAQGRHPWRPAHIHFKLSAPGHATVVTHIFVEGDAYLASDTVFGVKSSLVRPFDGGLTHDFVLERGDPSDATARASAPAVSSASASENAAMT